MTLLDNPGAAESNSSAPVAITFTVTKEILVRIEKDRMTLDQLFILISTDQNAQDLIEACFNTLSAVAGLKLHGFLEQDRSLSEKGKLLLEELGIQSKTNQMTSLRLLCQTYLELFPKMKLPSGVQARVNILEIEKKMKAFKTTYKKSFKDFYGLAFTDEDILKATKNYVERYRVNGYMYMANSSYFIQKGPKSELANELLAFKQGRDKPSKDPFEKRL